MPNWRRSTLDVSGPFGEVAVRFCSVEAMERDADQMFFANPWGLLGLLALPAIVVIHLYHRRYPTLFVAGLHLWGIETQTTTAGRTREQLPITPSLICELSAALLLSLVLADPRWGHLGKVEHLIVVLDNSASMMSKPAGLEEKSFRDKAIAELEQRAQSMPRGSVVTLLRTARRPEMLAGPAVPWDEAKLKLVDWQPALPKHDFHPTWDLAAQLAADTGNLLFLTDVVPDKSVPLPQAMEVVSLGRELENLAIAAARWDFDAKSAKGRVFVRVANHGKRPATVRVLGAVPSGSAEVPARAVFQNELAIEPGQAKPLEVDVPGGLGRLTVEIEAIGDGLATDNRVELIEPKVRMLHVAVAFPKDSIAGRAVRRVLQNFPDVTLSESSEAELVIAPAQPLPPSQRELWWLGIGPIETSDEARKQAKDLAGPFVLEKQNPLLDGVTLNGIAWGGVQPVAADVSPIITAGSSPLFSRINGTRTAAFILNIDLARTNLTDSPDWPILLSNLIESRRDNMPGLRRWNYRLNEEIRFRLIEESPASPIASSNATESKSSTDAPSSPADAPSARTVWLVHNGNKRPLARAAVIEVPQLDEVGVYEVFDGDQSVGQFAVNFHDADESTLTGLRPGSRAAEHVAAASGFAIDQPLTWLILVGIVLILIVAFVDWRVLRPATRRM